MPLRAGSLSLFPSQARVLPDGAQIAHPVNRSGSGIGNPWISPVERSNSATPVVQSGGLRQALNASLLPSGDQCGDSARLLTSRGSPPSGPTAERSRVSSFPGLRRSNAMSSPPANGVAVAVAVALDPPGAG